MLDRHILTLQKRLLHRPALWLAQRGVVADALTLAGFLAGLAAAVLIVQEAYLAALVAILVNRILDGLDGAVARQGQPTDRGAFLDIAFDFLFYALIPAAFALADPAANAIPAVALLVAFAGTGSSFLAFAAIAAKRGITATAFPQKGIYYLGGLTEGTETILAFALMCLLPAAFPLIAWLFAALALLTTLMRWWWGWRLFAQTPP
jgi:phosphatidylglycerophosphate synthase